MKKLSRFFVCFALAFSLMLGFSACDKKPETPPETPKQEEKFLEKVLTLEEFETEMEGLDYTFSDGFSVNLATTYADGTADSSSQLWHMEEGEAVAKINVSGKYEFEAFLSNSTIYYDDGENKVYSYLEICREVPEFKTYIAYDYFAAIQIPTGDDAFKLTDGSFFEDLRETFVLEVRESGDGEDGEYIDTSKIQIKKLYNDVHTNFVISYARDYDTTFVFTLKFEGQKLLGNEIEVSSSVMTRKISIEHFAGEVPLPDLETFEVEVKPEG